MKAITLLLLLLIVSSCGPIEPLEREEVIEFDSSYVFMDMEKLIMCDSLNNK